MIATSAPPPSKRIAIQRDQTNGWKSVTLVRPRPDRVPPFLSVDEYLAEVKQRLDEGQPVLPPSTPDEYRALIRQYPDVARPLLPPAPELERMGISKHSCREIEPLPIEWRERFLKTLAIDPDFRAAVASVIGGAE